MPVGNRLWPRQLRRMLSSMWLFLLLMVTAVVVWTAGYHTLVCSSSVRVSLEEVQRQSQGQGPWSPSSRGHHQHRGPWHQHSSLHAGEEDHNNDNNNVNDDDYSAKRHAHVGDLRRRLSVLADFESSVNSTFTAWRLTFRANLPLYDNEPVNSSKYFIPREQEVNPLVTRYIMEPGDKMCGGGAGGGDGGGEFHFLLIMVPSLTSHVTMRQTIRETWGSVAVPGAAPWPGTKGMPSVRVVFVFGRSPLGQEEEETVLEMESRAHGDILYADFVDSYRNLTYKSLTSLHWASSRCPGAAFVMKVDEDTFVNVPYLMEYLFYHGPQLTRSVVGYTIYRPISVRTGKWAVNFSDYPLPLFPRYVFGHSYVISSDVLADLVNASRFLPFVPVEDAEVTGVLAKVVGATRMHNSLFARKDEGLYTCAVVHNLKITITPITEKGHRILWDAVQSGNCSYDLLLHGTNAASVVRNASNRWKKNAENFILK